jgi:4-amino-4-deoxy-L-arabinose transferase-like glycosyltransferase
VVRVVAFLALDRHHSPDVWESETIARNLLEGRGFTYQFLGTTYRSYMEPLYPGLCAAVYALTGHSFLALGLVQAALGTLLVWLVFACGRRIAGDAAGLWAAGLAAVHPGLIAYTTKFHPFVLDALLLLAVLAAGLFFSTSRPLRAAVVLGAAIGLCVLSRATVLVCLPVMGWWVAARLPRGRLVALALAAGTAALVVAPWVARNYLVHHRFILTRSGTGLVFWLGNNPHVFTGSAATATGDPLYQLIPHEQRRRLEQLDELGQQELFRAEATAFVRARPLAFVQRWAVKLGYFWWQSPQAGHLYPAAGFRLYQAFYLLMMALAITGVVTHRRQRETWLLVGFCASIAVVQSAYYVEGRHRLAIEPVLLLLAGAGAVRLTQLLPWGKKVSS